MRTIDVLHMYDVILDSGPEHDRVSMRTDRCPDQQISEHNDHINHPFGIGTYGGNRVKRFRDIGVIGGHLAVDGPGRWESAPAHNCRIGTDSVRAV